MVIIIFNKRKLNLILNYLINFLEIKEINNEISSR